MKFEVFRMERMQSTYENVVLYNLSESGVHPLTIRELLSEGEEETELLDLRLGYSHTNGTPELRRLIAETYTDCTEKNVLVTNGSSEANFVSVWNLLDEGDRVVFIAPNYMQIGGLARSFGASVTEVYLQQDRDWSMDLGELSQVINRKTKLIALCSPNNPTGSILSKQEINAITDAAAESDAWIVSDEVYRGAELDRNVTPSLFGEYDKTLAIGGLSKAYGLPGLRIGWVVGPEEEIERIWARHDYTTIGPSAVGDKLARIAVLRRRKIFERTRQILNRNLRVLDEWVREHADLLSYARPKAGAIAFIKYSLKANSSWLMEGLRERKSVLAMPGDHFGLDGFFRVGYGCEGRHLEEGLRLLGEYLHEVNASTSKSR